MVEKQEDKYATEKQVIYEEVHQEKMKKQNEEMQRRMFRLLINLPAILYFGMSSAIIAMSLALTYTLRMVNWIIHDEYDAIITSYLMVAFIFTIWLIFGAVVIYTDRHREETYKRVCERKGIKP